MKNKNAMSIKAIINNIAKKNNVAAQLVLQTYMLERLLERISISKYKDNFILKGGMLISALLGIDTRTTMDIDTTIKDFQLDEENLYNIMTEICSTNIDDNITFEIKKIDLIREDDDYGGYRVTFIARYNNEMPVTIKIDVTTGDKITYKEVKYKFTLMLENRSIDIWSYNIETILAEKFEAVIKRGVLSTRIRDYYDIYMLMKTQRSNIEDKTLYDAIAFTTKHRESEKSIKEWKKVVETLKQDEIMQKQWKRYQNSSFYAREIEYSELIKSIEEIGMIFDRYTSR